jgi:hypothetical protein
MHKSHAFDGVEDKTLLESLNAWPPEMVSWQRDAGLIKALNMLCKKFGYGAVLHMAAQIEDIWRHPEKVEDYKKTNAEHHEFVRNTTKKHLAGLPGPFEKI